jgi:hypothetical protein
MIWSFQRSMVRPSWLSSGGLVASCRSK